MSYKGHPNLQKKGNSLYFVKRVLGKPKWTKIGTIHNELDVMQAYKRLVSANQSTDSDNVYGIAKGFIVALEDPRNPLDNWITG